MTTELETWERRHFVEGGAPPFLFYVIYGEMDMSTGLSRSAYRTNGAPKGASMMSYGPEKHPETPASFCQGYLWERLVADAPDFASTIRGCDRCLILKGTPSDFSTLNYLRDAVGLITYLLDQGGCAIYDPQMFHWWQPAEWKQLVFEPGQPAPRRHTVVLVSAEDSSTKWFHTRGMRKFGRPDISVHNVPPELEDGAMDLCNRLIDYQASGHIIRDGQEVRLSSLPMGGVIHNAGDLEDPDFNNVHLDVRLYDAPA